jgi:hypothetical protein
MCRLSWTGLVHKRDTIWSWQPASSGLRRPFGRSAEPELESEDLKQFLDQLAVSRGRDHRIHAVAKLHQADATPLVKRKADDALQRRRPCVVERDLDIGCKVFAVVCDRQLQLNPSPEESTSSRS